MCDTWQSDDGRAAAVLHQVFGWLTARELCAASGACAAWRRAAAAPALWRRLLQTDAGLSHTHMATLADHIGSWREEYVLSFAGWSLSERVCACAGNAIHAALEQSPPLRLALLTDDATIAIWQCIEGEWVQCWSSGLQRRGWSGAVRCQWAARAAPARLLAAGALALVDSWELLVFQIDDEGCGSVVSRARCSAGAAGCWADGTGDAFFSLELSVFAPSVALTTIWLNSATQETQSEYTGVTSPMLRVYNEGGAHMTHAIVVESELELDTSHHAATVLTADATTNDLSHYFKHISQKEDTEAITVRLLVMMSGSYEWGAVSAWGVSAARPPPLCAAERGDLLERVRRAAAAPPAPAAPAPAAPPAPSERDVRALCTPPDDVCALPTRPVGLEPHRSGRCLWVTLSDGSAWALSLPTLRPLRRLFPPLLPRQVSASTFDLLHYIQPAVSDLYFASPRGLASGAVRVWSAASAGACPPARRPAHPHPALVALLPPVRPPILLVLSGDSIYVWRSRVTVQPPSEELLCAHTFYKLPPYLKSSWPRAVSRSCDGESSSPASPCPPQPRPACRPPPPAQSECGVRVTCCPPPRGARPPCPAPPRAPPLSCSNVTAVDFTHDSCVESSLERCGDRQDKVARKLAAAEAIRRADYEKEAKEKISSATPEAGYMLGVERHCRRASDGRMYTLPCPPGPAGPCGPDRTPPAPQIMPINSNDGCTFNSDGYVDPCAHRPRTFVEIARDQPNPRHSKVSETREPKTVDPAFSSPPPRGITSRIFDSLSIGRKMTRTGVDGASGKRGGPPGGSRGFHSSTTLKNTKSVDNMLRERSQLKEAGIGRMMTCDTTTPPMPAPTPLPAGHLELNVPRSTQRVTVCVKLEGEAAPSTPDTCLRKNIPVSQCSQKSERKDPWLSLKSIQEKISMCKSKVSSLTPGSDKCDNIATPTKKGPCPSRPPCTPSPPLRPTPCPGQPPRPPPCPSQPPRTNNYPSQPPTSAEPSCTPSPTPTLKTHGKKTKPKTPEEKTKPKTPEETSKPKIPEQKTKAKTLDDKNKPGGKQMTKCTSIPLIPFYVSHS